MKRPEAEFFIPQEVVIQVLKNLPVKSLLRFRCVSKQWLSIIDDPCFIDLHRVCSYSRPGGVSFLIQRERGDSTDLYSFHPGSTSAPRLICTKEFIYKFQHSLPVEGLVCFGNQIWNPSTRKRIEFPPVPILRRNEEERWSDPHYFLGFNHSSNEYKVLSISFVLQKNELGYIIRRYCVPQVLTLGTNAWRTVDALHYNKLLRNCHSTSYCCIKDVLYINFCAYRFIIAFELGTEKSRIIPFPESAQWQYVHHLQDVRGNTGLINIGLVNYGRKMTLILEDENNGSWKVESTFFPPNWNLNSPWSSLPPIRYCYGLEIDVPDDLKELLDDHYYYVAKQVETLLSSRFLH